MPSSARFLIIALALINGINADSLSSLVSQVQGTLTSLVPPDTAASISSVYMNLARNQMDPLCGDFKVEAKVSDDYTVGANLDLSGTPLKSIFAKFTAKVCGYTLDSDLTMEMSDQSIFGDITYLEGEHTFKAGVTNTALSTLTYFRSGPGWSVKPSFNLKANAIALEGSYEYSADTLVSMNMGAPGQSTLTVDHTIDSATKIKVGMDGAGTSTLRVEIIHELDDTDTVKPRYDAASKQFALGWVRKLETGRTLNIDMNPNKSVGIMVDGNADEDWKVSVSAPWGRLGAPDVSFGRKFEF